MSFLDNLPPHGAERDTYILAAIRVGKLDFPTWHPVSIGNNTLLVSRDYLTIDGNRIPMSAPVAQEAVESLDCLLPTPAVVDAIEQHATLIPFDAWPQWQGDSQLATEQIRWREENIARRLGARNPFLLAGHLKDVVLSDFMPAGRVVIYGALTEHGSRVQPLYPIPGGKPGHSATFDGGYAHGIRAVRRKCFVKGREACLDDLYASAPLGPVAALRYPTSVAVPSPPPTGSQPTVRRGDRGPSVKLAQERLVAHGYKLDADGIFGPKTDAAVRAFQEHSGLTSDGIVGPKTWAALNEEALPATNPNPLVLAPALSDEVVDTLFGPISWVPAPTASEPGAVKITNNWQTRNLVAVEIPQLRGITGAPASGKVFLHRLIAEQTRALWAAWEKAGLLPLVLTWAGSWNPRLVRDGSTLSRHAYATGWDINAAWNMMGNPAAPAGAKGSVVELLPLAIEHGYTNGMNWDRPDGMHFEAVRVL